MVNILCWLGIHDWTKWYSSVNAKRDFRTCRRCYKRIERRVV